MNVRHLVPSVSRRLLALGSLMLAAGLQPVHAAGVDLSKFRRIEPQFIAALGDPGPRPAAARNLGLLEQGPGPARRASWTNYPEWKKRRRGAGTVEIRCLRTGGWRNTA